ncbi:MAG: reverse transcriptase family protein, partial [Candidatus Thiodiazotropha taylori]|nr:reverse transcriptase family protein [Candidatus Thiodiazotropha taylori]
MTTAHDRLGKFDAGAQIDMVILDFSKAFDTVPHRKLLHKMKLYGVNSKINAWLCDFLTRKMKVVVDGEESDAVTVDSGVPQGTVLGPLLFLCHINDLPDTVKSTVRLFADDCLLYRPIRAASDHIALQNDLQQLEIWAKTWGMRFNAKKCYIMSINSKSSHFYQLGDHILQQVPENPYLGITLSEDLKWGSHISKITKKANSTLGFLRRNLKHCPPSCRRTAYLSLIRSTLEYSSIVWDPHLQKDIDKFEKVQRQAARFITGDYSSRDQGCVTRMLQDLALPSLHDRRKTNRLIFFYKVVEGLVPALQCHDILTPVRGKRQIKTRQYTDFVTSNIFESQSTNNSK